MLDLSPWLELVKYLSIAVGSLLALTAIVVDFRDENRRLTRWGIVAILGVLASGVIGAAAQSMESREKAAEAARQSAAFNETLQGQRRALEQLNLLLNESGRQLQAIAESRKDQGVQIEQMRKNADATRVLLRQSYRQLLPV